jgi:conjugal transfer pilus assembly protein TraW
VRPVRTRGAERRLVRLAAGALVTLGTLSGVPARAVDLGTIGPTYGIAEPHLLEFIQQRLRDKERTGELQRLIQEARSRGVAAVQHPAPVAGLRTTGAARTFYFDPSFTLDRNIVDAQGRLLFPAGTRKNPLEVVSMSKRLLFFDARDGRQVSRAKELIARHDGQVKPILTGGSYLDLMKVWRLPVYYDQQGALTRRFGIRQVPAIVSQEGLRLRIDEVLVR